MTITHDDFSKVEIRVGKILSVEEVPETDKLLKLIADIQALVGMKTTFVTNLEPRMIKGFESNGMLFAVGGDENFSFLTPTEDVPPGTGTK